MPDQYGCGKIGFLDPSLHLFIDDDEIRDTLRICRYWSRHGRQAGRRRACPMVSVR